MLDVKQLTGEELYLIREGLLNINCIYTPKFIELHEKMKEDVNNEWMERTWRLKG